MARDEPLNALLRQRNSLVRRVRQEREQLEQLRTIASNLQERLASGERLLREIDSVLGREPQLRLDDSDVRLRGRRLEEVAVAVLAQERGSEVEVHYREWFDLLRARGHHVSGKEPLNTFLAQINRSDAVLPVGRRTGLYKLAA